jgi:hypothetical protein
LIPGKKRVSSGGRGAEVVRSRSTRACAALIVLVHVACGEATVGDGSTDGDVIGDALEERDGEGELVVTYLGSSHRVFDPKLEGAAASIEYALETGGDSARVSIHIEQAGRTVRVLLDSADRDGGTHAEPWDGKDDLGLLVDPGEYIVVVDAALGSRQDSATGAMNVIRIGAVEMDFVGDDTYAIMYHRTSGTDHDDHPIEGPEWRIGADLPEDLSDMDTNDGLARGEAMPWEEPSHPPQDPADPDGVEDDNHNLPACCRMGSSPVVQLRLGPGGVSQQSGAFVEPGYPVDGIGLRVTAAGFGTSDDEDLEPGAAATIVMQDPLASSVGAGLLSIDLVFEYSDAGAWIPLPGFQPTSHRVYRTFGPPRFESTGAPNMPWVAVLENVTGVVPGEDHRALDVISALTEHVLVGEGLVYNNADGTHRYTDMDISVASDLVTINLNWVEFHLTEYLERPAPAIVNCSDCACILSTYMSMLGIDGYYFQLWNRNYRSGIALNYIKVIGTSEFSNLPTYGGDVWGYHALVTTEPDISRVSDSCLYLDGDGDPASTPCTELLPDDIDYATYLGTLTPEPGRIRATRAVKCSLE